LVILKENKIQ